LTKIAAVSASIDRDQRQTFSISSVTQRLT
jgi:hypothetical protein